MDKQVIFACSEACSREFACCVTYKSTAACRAEVDSPANWTHDVTGFLGVLQRAGCAVGCRPIPGLSCGCKPSEPTARRPQRPTRCTSALEGRCDCANLRSPRPPGLVTYVWWPDGGEVQRCATLYVPPRLSLVPSGAPTANVVVHFNCYACDTLWQLGMQLGDPLLRAADRQGFAVLALSAPERRWTFGGALV